MDRAIIYAQKVPFLEIGEPLARSGRVYPNGKTSHTYETCMQKLIRVTCYDINRRRD